MTGPDAPDGLEDGARPARTVLTLERRPNGDRGWMLALLPGFPLLLLVLRVWYLARQDPQTMLLVLQAANPLGLIASLLISLLWALPAALLLLRVLYLLLVASLHPVDGDGPEVDGRTTRSWLVRAGQRAPGWLTPPAVLLALLTWQLRFLPTLLALALVVGGLEARRRFGPNRFATQASAVAVPVAAAVLVLIWLGPAILDGFGSADDPVTALLLLVPPLVAPLLGGPLPGRAARRLLPAVASALALCTPVLIGGDYLSTPVLPQVAIESTTAAAAPDGSTTESEDRMMDADATVVRRGSLVSVDDRFTTLLDRSGRVVFLRSDRIVAQSLCFTGPEPPSSRVSAHGWQVERSVLSWAAPTPLRTAPDARCRGA